MKKFIVVRCRGREYKVYEDITRNAIYRFRRAAPPLPQYLSGQDYQPSDLLFNSASV